MLKKFKQHEGTGYGGNHHGPQDVLLNTETITAIEKSPPFDGVPCVRAVIPCGHWYVVEGTLEDFLPGAGKQFDLMDYARGPVGQEQRDAVDALVDLAAEAAGRIRDKHPGNWQDRWLERFEVQFDRIGGKAG